jgi:hypothetical protein
MHVTHTAKGEPHDCLAGAGCCGELVNPRRVTSDGDVASRQNQPLHVSTTVHPCAAQMIEYYKTPVPATLFFRFLHNRFYLFYLFPFIEAADRSICLYK